MTTKTNNIAESTDSNSALNQYSQNEWVRLPAPKKRLFGLSRTTLLQLISVNAIKSVHLKKKNAQRGIRLIELNSLHAFFDKIAAKSSSSKKEQL